MTEKEKMLAGELYDASDGSLTNERYAARELLYDYNHTRPGDKALRLDIITRLVKAQGTITIEPPFYCDYGYNIVFGNNFYANYGCVILDVNAVIVGANVLLGPYVQIYTATHPVNPAARLEGKEYAAPVNIGDNVWIGGNAIVCPGVTIGKNTTIGAGGVVTRDIPDGVFAAGNPCRVIRKISMTD